MADDTLPNANELFPADDKPDANDLFPVSRDAERTQKFGTSPIQDLIFGDDTVNPIARVLHKFGQSVADDWGAGKAARLSDETQDYLKVNKLFDGWNENQSSMFKTANQVLFRPAATQLVQEVHDSAAVIHGVSSVIGGVQAGIAQLGEELGSPKLGKEVAGAIEAFPTGLKQPTGTFHAPPHPAIQAIADVQAEINKAHELGVLNGEAGPSVPISAPQVATPKPPRAGMPTDLFEEPREEKPVAAPTPAVTTPTEPAAPNPIAEDVAGKLIAAGRPPEEALAAGQLIAAHHQARAERFAGAMGTAEDSYHKDGADIRAANPDLPGGSALLPLSDETTAAVTKPEAPPEGTSEVVPVEPPKPTPGAAAAEPIQTIPELKKTLRGRAAADPQTWSLFEFLAKEGGLKPTDDLLSIFGNTRGPFVPGFGPLLRKGGLTMDEALTRAKENAYILDPNDIQHVPGAANVGELTTSVNDLHDLIDHESRGQKTYRVGHVAKEKAIEPEHEAGQILDELHRQIKETSGFQEKVDPAVEDRVVQIIQKEGGTDVLGAYERAIMEDADRHEGTLNARRNAEIGLLDGWDHPNGEPAQVHGGNIAEARRQAGASSEAARGANGEEPRSHGEGDRGPSNSGEGIAGANEELVYDQKSDGRRTVYHGSRDVVATFDPAKTRLDRGVFFADDPNLASKFAEGRAVDNDPARIYGDDTNKEITRWVEEHAGTSEARRITALMDEAEGLEWGTERKDALATKINDEISKLTGLDQSYGGSHPNVTMARISLGKNRKVDMGGRFDWDKEREAIDYARKHGFDSVTFTNTGEAGDYHSVLNRDNIHPFHAEEFTYDQKKGWERTKAGEQNILPGTAQSAKQLAAQREAAGHGRIQSKVAQKEPGGLFDTEGRKQTDLFEQTKRGQIRLRDGFRAVITLFKDANASTFIHETGHHWLAELMSDALHEKAPADLKADAKTVMNWLNVESPSAIKTRHHEKFARGFERYMMEGKAPTQALASVFNKFKNWLTKIYGSVARLKSPINDEIRGVFDRLLTMHPNEVRIEPEPAPLTVPDIHEADAAHAPPEMAHPVAETVQGERDSLAGEHLSKGQADARLENVKGEAERRAAGNREPGGHANEAGAVEKGQGDNAPTGTVGEGGVEAAPTGDQAPTVTGNQSPVGDAPPPIAAPKENPQSPHDKFPDKAGNIVLNNLNTTEDLKAIIRNSAEDNGDYQHVRGPISDAQVLDLAEAAGVDAAYIDTRKLGEAWTAPQIVALRRLLVQSAQAVHDIAKKAALGAEADVMAYAEAVTRHRLIQETVSSVTAEAGRALRAFQSRFMGEGTVDIGNLIQDATGKTLFQLQQEAKYLSKLQTPGQASKFVNDTNKGKFRSAVLEYYVNALISGPITHTRYIVSNAINAVWTPLVEIPFSAVSGKVREIKAGQPIERVHIGEAGAQLYGLMKGSRDGLYAAIEAFTSGVSPALPTERVSPQFAEASRAIPGVIGSAIRIPGKSVAGIHSFFKSLRYEQNINGIAYRTASNEGLTGKAFSDRVADLTTTPSEAMMREATSNALRELYMSPADYHSALGGMVRFTNNFLPAKIIVPFMKIGSQITRGAWMDKFATGLASGKIRETLAGGGSAADLQAGRITAGTALFGAAFGMAAEGFMTGDGPSDPKDRSVWLLAHKPNTLQIGDMTFHYGNTGPLGMLMRTAANMHELGHTMDEHGIGAVATEFFEAIAKSVLDETFLRGFKDMLDAVFHPKEYGGRYAVSMVTNWLPNSVGLSQVARKIDPYQRETAGISHPVQAVLEAAQAKIPWLSEKLMPRRDMFGEPIRNDGPNPDYANDPVVKAMDALNGSGVGRMNKKIQGVELTAQQYDDVSRIAGRHAKMLLNAQIGIISNPLVPAGQRIEIIHKSISDARELARKFVMMQSIGTEHDIMKAAMSAKIEKKTKLATTD